MQMFRRKITKNINLLKLKRNQWLMCFVCYSTLCMVPLGTNLGFFLRFAHRHSVMLSSFTTVCMFPVSVSVLALALYQAWGEQLIFPASYKKSQCNHSQHLPVNADGATFKISSVISSCLWWTSSCRFMSSSLCFCPSCGSLTNTSSSSMSCDRKLWLNQHHVVHWIWQVILYCSCSQFVSLSVGLKWSVLSH